MISDQQKQITKLTSLFSQMAHKSQYKRGINNKGEKVCFHCKQTSHFKKVCPKLRRSGKKENMHANEGNLKG